MFCSKCGNQVIETAAFCGSCGHALKAVFNDAYPSQGYATSTVACGRTLDLPPIQIDHSAYRGATRRSEKVHSRSCLGQAWKDMTSSEGWIKREFLLMVMGAIPILNIFVDGYNLEWGADAAKGKMSPLPKGTFSGKTFMTGLFYVVLNILFVIANLWTFAIGVIPFFGILISFVLQLLATSFLALAGVRMSMKGSIKAAFDMSAIFKRYKQNLGSLVAGVCLPSIIVVLLVGMIAIAILSIYFFTAGSMFFGGSPFGSPYGAYQMGAFLTAIPATLLTMIPLVIALIMLFSFFMTFAQTWSFRAVGIWVDRFATDWRDEDDESNEK